MKYISKGNVSLLLAILLLFASSDLVSTHEGGLSISHAKIVFHSKRNGRGDPAPTPPSFVVTDG